VHRHADDDLGETIVNVALPVMQENLASVPLAVVTAIESIATSPFLIGGSASRSGSWSGS
jgi:hypothetical protein